MWDSPDKEDWNGNLLGYYVGYQMTANVDDIGPTQGFNFKTVEVRSHFGGETLLQNLNKFTQYSIVVQAYTSQGSGPPSKEILVSSLEDGNEIESNLGGDFENENFLFAVPSYPPETPKCDVLSSTSIYITWSPPPVDGQNGKIKGYRVSYISIDDIYGKMRNMIIMIHKITSNIILRSRN